MAVIDPDNPFGFLSDGGKTGSMIRVKDWRETTLGAPNQWPQSLRTTLNLILQLPTPFILCWGKDHICFYNDAYLAVLGDNIVDATILEIHAEAVFKKNWVIARPMIEDVLRTGCSSSNDETPESFLTADQSQNAIRIQCMPVIDESGMPGGVLISLLKTSPEDDHNKKKLEENEAKLKIVVEASELATWELDLRTRAASYSSRYLEILGYPAGTILTHPEILKHLHPDDLQIRESAFKEAFITGTLHYKSRIIWNDQSLHWIEGRGKVFFDDKGSPTHMVGTLRDITAEKNYQRELEEREQKFRLLADSIPQHIWTSDHEGKINYYNRSLFDYSGISHHQILQYGWIQIVHQEDRPETIAQFTACLRTGNSYLMEHRMLKHTGEYRWHLTSAVPQKDDSGKIRMWVGTSTDIQEQKTFTTELERQVQDRTRELIQLNESLKKSEERYHLMVEEVQDYAILYLNPEGVVENWNAGAEKIKGYHADEIIGKNFSVFYTEKDVNSNLPQTLLQRASTTGRAVQEGFRVRKDGTLFWASVVITAVHNERNDVIGFSKVTHDLTEKKEANDKLIKNASELEQKNEDLRKMNKELEAFAYISSHDLQEPLRKIQTFATRIAEKEKQNLSEYGKDYFSRMQNAAVRMQTLIDDLLAYSRTNNAERRYEATNLSLLVEEVKADFQEELQQKGATIEIGEMCTIDIIPFQFRQLLYNLVGNSLKFSVADRPPHIKIQSTIIAKNPLEKNPLDTFESYCHIQLADNGIGFEQQYGEKIFELFQRLHGRATFMGTGIGLAIVKKIVDNHDGLIKARGEVNQGATFDIYIPASLSEEGLKG